MPRFVAVGLSAIAVWGSAGCHEQAAAPSTPRSDAPAFAFKVSAVDTRFKTRDHFIASIEMQLSGEPLAEALGRDVRGYNRDYACQDAVCAAATYTPPRDRAATDDVQPMERLDLAGFSTAIESYEYSKQPMNNVAFESGAGTSLLFGPVLNPAGATGSAALQLAQTWITHMAGASNATRRAEVSASSPLGWPGLWLTLQPFSSWDPAIRPSTDGQCSLTSDDNPGAARAFLSDNYECDYTTLHLPDRAAQVSMTIDPGASGWSAWKEALWTLNYLQVMHDVHETGFEHVNETQLANVGIPGNTTGPGTKPGTYLGSSNIEGFQAGNFIQILDNQAAEWLQTLSTSDGETLGGFPDVAAALAYNPNAPLRWFPGSIAVTEREDPSGFPRPESYRIASPDSHLLDLAGLLGANASAYSLTDHKNQDVGGSQAVRVYFDDDPFPEQNQTPTGAATFHDRTLAMLRVVLVNIDRLHFDPKTSLFADDVTLAGGKPKRGTMLSTDVAAYTLFALRNARRALDSQLTLYGNNTPDTAGIPCPLDAFAYTADASYAQRLDKLINALADSFFNKLTSADGRAYAGWNLATGAPTDRATSLDGHTAAIRGLLLAYLATGTTKYRDRAFSVWKRLEQAFYDPNARVYRELADDGSDQVTFTPRRFGLLQAALRETYHMIALLPGNDALRTTLEERLGRLNALVLNGWDDRNRDELVEWPEECAQLGTAPDGKPLGLGGLQMAERTLTGESGTLPDTEAGERVLATDREHDCVPEIAAVGLPSALAGSVTFKLAPLSAIPAKQTWPRPDAGVAP